MLPVAAAPGGVRPAVRLWTMGGALVACAPFLFMAATAGSLTGLYVALAGFGLARGIYGANIYAALFDEVGDRVRARVAGLIVACSFVAGAAAPAAMGALASSHGLRGGTTLLAAAALLAGTVCGGLAFAARGTSSDKPVPRGSGTH